MKNKLVYREAKNIEELECLLRLRYLVFKNSKHQNFCNDSTYAIDLDQYDLCSRHFGLFHVKKDNEIPVGYMRVVQVGYSPMASEILKIANKASQNLLLKVITPKKNCFPAMDYFESPKPLTAFHEEIKSKDKKLVEVSRFCLAKSVRSLKVAKFVIESAFAIYGFVEKYNNAIISINDTHFKIYNSYGFSKIGNIPSYHVNGFPAALLHVSLDKISNEARERIIYKANQYKAIGTISTGYSERLPVVTIHNMKINQIKQQVFSSS